MSCSKWPGGISGGRGSVRAGRRLGSPGGSPCQGRPCSLAALRMGIAGRSRLLQMPLVGVAASLHLAVAMVPALATEPVRLTRDGARKIAPTFIEGGAALVHAAHERPNLVA